jgi:hypothetical protein
MMVVGTKLDLVDEREVQRNIYSVVGKRFIYETSTEIGTSQE